MRKRRSFPKGSAREALERRTRSKIEREVERLREEEARLRKEIGTRVSEAYRKQRDHFMSLPADQRALLREQMRAMQERHKLAFEEQRGRFQKQAREVGDVSDLYWDLLSHLSPEERERVLEEEATASLEADFFPPRPSWG